MPTASTLLAEELFASADPRFLATLYDVQVPRGTTKQPGYGGRSYEVPAPFSRAPHKSHPLGSFAKRWLEDPRLWAREQLFAYIADGLDRPGHRPLVKRLYKGAEERGDHELIGRFLVAFDHMTRMRTRVRRVYDWTARQTVERTTVRPIKPRTNGVLHFSQRTRGYLQARAARYLRALGAKDAASYRRVVLDALTRYEDQDFTAGLQLVRMRGLTMVLFGRSDVLARTGRRVHLADSKRTLADLVPSPHHTEAWTAAGPEILEALPRTRALFLRRQLVRWLERDHAGSLARLEVAGVRALLGSSYADVRLFAARLLEKVAGVENILLEDWLALLELDDAEILPLIAARMSAAVTPARASLAQCVALARHRAHAPAMLGLEWAETKDITTKEELEQALPIVDADVAEARARGLAWLTPALVSERVGLDAHLREILDARHADVRAKGFALLETTPRFRDSIVLWAALTESPHADARAFLLSLLARRRLALESTHLGDKSLHHLWATTILEVHRGSRAKQRALVQLGERLESQPQQADILLPLLSLALRSVRETERRGALAALVRTAARQPEVRDAIARHAPEIVIAWPAGAAA